MYNSENETSSIVYVVFNTKIKMLETEQGIYTINMKEKDIKIRNIQNKE